MKRKVLSGEVGQLLLEERNSPDQFLALCQLKIDLLLVSTAVQKIFFKTER